MLAWVFVLFLRRRNIFLLIRKKPWLGLMGNMCRVFRSSENVQEMGHLEFVQGRKQLDISGMPRAKNTGIFGERRVVLNIKCLKGAMHYCSMGSICIYASPTQVARSRLLSVAVPPLQNSLNSPQAKSRLNTLEKCAYFFFGQTVFTTFLLSAEWPSVAAAHPV